MLEHILSIFWGVFYLGVLTLAAWVIGQLYPSCLVHFSNPTQNTVSRIALGFLSISTLVFLLAAAHLSSKENMQYLFIILALLAVYGLKISGIFRFDLRGISEIFRDRSVFLITTAFVLYGIWIMITATLPPTARDELIYHLEIPKQWLKSSGHYRSLDNIYAYFPQLGESLFALSLAGAGEVAAKLTHALFGILLACALYTFSRQFMSRVYALFASLLFVSVPSVMISMGWAYVDLIFSFYAFLALLATSEFVKTTDWRWSFFSGIMLGGCVATKYTGISFAAVILCTALLSTTFITKAKTLSFGKIILMLAVFTVPAALWGFPYIVRNWYQTGWPLFPFELPFFILKPDMNWDPARAKLYLTYLTSFGIPIGHESIWHSFAAPFLVFVRGKFNEPRFYEGVLSPLFLLTPIFLIKKDKPLEVKIHIAFVIVFLYFWAFTTKQIRFLFPVLPSLCFLLMYGISRADQKPILGIALSLAVLANFFTGLDEIMKLKPMDFWRGRETRQDYLRRQWDGFRAYELANQIESTPANVYLVNMKNYVYFLNVSWRSDFVFERYWLEEILSQSPEQASLKDHFLRRGITHLLIDEQFAFSPAWGLEKPSADRLRAFLASTATVIARESHFTMYSII